MAEAWAPKAPQATLFKIIYVCSKMCIMTGNPADLCLDLNVCPNVTGWRLIMFCSNLVIFSVRQETSNSLSVHTNSLKSLRGHKAVNSVCVNVYACTLRQSDYDSNSCPSSYRHMSMERLRGSTSSASKGTGEKH